MRPMLKVKPPSGCIKRLAIDAVLDATRISLDCTLTSCTERILSPAGSVLVTWNGNIATTGISLSWTATTSNGGTTGGTVTANLGSCKAPKAGTYSLVVQTSVAGLGGLTVPEVCIDGLPAAPASPSRTASRTTRTRCPTVTRTS